MRKKTKERMARIRQHQQDSDLSTRTELEWTLEWEMRQLTMLNEELVKWSNIVSDDMARMRKRLAEAAEREDLDLHAVNSLGELQNAGREINRLCALREKQRETVVMLAALTSKALGLENSDES